MLGETRRLQIALQVPPPGFQLIILLLELAPHGITVNVLCPGITDTSQPRGHQTEEQIYAQGQRIPLGRIGQPEDLVGPTIFLASDAARFITGQTILANGGGIM